MIGQLGTYTLLEELGRGGMGAVYRARHDGSGREVALKRLLPQVLGDVEVLARFRREAMALRGVNHPNLVTVLDAQLEGSEPFIVFELVEGPSLRARVEAEGPLPWRTAARVVAEVAAGLSAAHDLQLLHRDIKPDNVLLGTDGAKLADFGLVKPLDLDSLTRTQAGILGTVGYVAPEQVSDDRSRLGETTDTYGLAATLYFALTGRDPFRAGTSIATLQAVITEPAPNPRRDGFDVPKWLSAVCVRGMSKLQRDRFPSAVALRAALLEPPSVQRLPLVLAAAVVLALSGLGLVAWTLSTREPEATQPTADSTPDPEPDPAPKTSKPQPEIPGGEPDEDRDRPPTFDGESEPLSPRARLEGLLRQALELTPPGDVAELRALVAKLEDVERACIDQPADLQGKILKGLWELSRERVIQLVNRRPELTRDQAFLDLLECAYRRALGAGNVSLRIDRLGNLVKAVNQVPTAVASSSTAVSLGQQLLKLLEEPTPVPIEVRVSLAQLLSYQGGVARERAGALLEQASGENLRFADRVEIARAWLKLDQPQRTLDGLKGKWRVRLRPQLSHPVHCLRLSAFRRGAGAMAAYRLEAAGLRMRRIPVGAHLGWANVMHGDWTKATLELKRMRKLEPWRQVELADELSALASAIEARNRELPPVASASATLGMKLFRPGLLPEAAPSEEPILRATERALYAGEQWIPARSILDVGEFTKHMSTVLSHAGRFGAPTRAEIRARCFEIALPEFKRLLGTALVIKDPRELRGLFDLTLEAVDDERALLTRLAEALVVSPKRFMELKNASASRAVALRLHRVTLRPDCSDQELELAVKVARITEADVDVEPMLEELVGRKTIAFPLRTEASGLALRAKRPELVLRFFDDAWLQGSPGVFAVVGWRLRLEARRQLGDLEAYLADAIAAEKQVRMPSPDRLCALIGLGRWEQARAELKRLEAFPAQQRANLGLADLSRFRDAIDREDTTLPTAFETK